MRVPESHADILEKPVRAVLSTFEPSGRLHSSLCTCLGEGGRLLITSVDPAQARQIGLNPKVSVLVMDPGNVDRWLCVQGDASVSGGAACEVSIRRVMVFPV
jgi:general stress protein 26